MLLILISKKDDQAFQKFPQANKITFFNRGNDARESIVQIQRIMEKLPKHTDNRSVS